MFKSSSRRAFLNFVITGILVVSFVFVPLSAFVQSAAAQEDILDPKWTRGGLGSTASSVLISDVRSDIPGEEVIVVGVDYVRAFDGRENYPGGTNLLWTRNLPEVWYWTQPQMADVNGDDIADVIVAFGDWPPGGNGLYILDGEDGSILVEKHGILGGNSITASLVVGDIDGDGYPTIFVASEDVTRELAGTARLTALDHLGNVLHQTFVWRACAGGLSLADGDRDDIYELYMGDRDMYMNDGGWGKGVRSFWAENLSVRWNHPDVLCSSQAPPLADVNGDGILDVIVSNQRGGVLVLDSRTGSAIRKDVSRRDLPTHYQGSIYDIDDDGNLEILFADGDHGSTPDDIAVFDLVDWQVDGRIDVGLCHYGPTVADVTGDGKMEIIATSYNGIHIIDPETYTVIDEVTGLGGDTQKLQNAVVQDIDGDGLVEIVVSSESGTVYAYDTPGLSPQARGLPRARTEMQFYSERRLGVAEDVPATGQEPEPIISSPFPTRKGVNVPVDLAELRFTLLDRHGDAMDYMVATSPNIGSWAAAGVSSGTEVSLALSTILDYYTTYLWEVKVTDGTYWTNRTFSFKTAFEPVVNTPPTHDSPLLDGGDGTSADDLVCSNQTTFDADGNAVTNIYNWFKDDDSLTTLLLPFDTRSATTARDYSGYDNHATIRGATWTSEGVVGGCYEFRGDDYIMIPHSSSLGGDGTWSEITVEMWILLTENQNGRRIISKIPSYEIGFQTSGAPNRLFAGVWTDSQREAGYNTPLATDTWYHVAFTYKDGEGIVLYIDGIVRDTASQSGLIKASAGSRLDTREPVYLGWFDFFKGKLDEVRIYPVALSPEQIYQRYLETKDGLSSSSTIVAFQTVAGDVWKCEVTPNDGWAYGEAELSSTIGPLVPGPPLASNLEIGPRPRPLALDSEDLVGSYDYFDYEGDPESGTEIRWYQNDVLQPAFNNSLTVSAGYTGVGDAWYFTVRPRDGINFGDLQTSDSVSIVENSPPTQGTPLLVSSAGTNRTDEDLVAFNQTTVDPDGNDVTNVYNWFRNDASLTNLLMSFDTESWTTVSDYSGYGNDGAVSGATWMEDGVVGGAYAFDGDDVITVPDDESLDGDNDWSEISVEFWVKTAAPLHGTRIVAKKAAISSTGSYMVGFQTSADDPANTLFWGINNGDGWEDIWDTTTTVLETGRWYHILCTYMSGPGLTIYINGTQRVNRPLTGFITRGSPSSDEPLFIGTSGQTDPQRWLVGALDEVRIYPEALSSAQVFQRYIETKDGLSGSSTIVAQETTADEEWKCQIIPNDSFIDGTGETSNTLTVLAAGPNSRPRIDMYTPTDTTPEVDEGEDLNFTHISSDPDDDPLTYSWLLDGVEQATTQNWTYTPGFGDAGTFNVTLVVDDGEFFDTQEWSVTVVATSVQYELMMEVIGSGTTVPAAGSHLYSAGTEVDVTAYADLGWVFSEWSGDLMGPVNPTTIIMDENKTVTATFIMEEYTLTINIEGSGSVDRNNTGPYYYGDAVELSAVADSGWEFFEWTEDLTGSDNPATIIMDGDKTVNATFVEVPPSNGYLVVRGLDDRIYYRVYNSSSSSWEDWNAVPSGATSDSPAAAVSSGRLYIVVRGLDGSSLWFGSINLTDNSFTGWTWLSGATDSAPTLVVFDDQLVLVVRGMDNRVYYRLYDCVAETWNGWTPWLSGATSDSPAAAVIEDELHIVVRGMDGFSLWHNYVNLTSSEFGAWQLVGGATESKPVLTFAEGSLELYLAVRGLDNSTYYNTWNGLSWEGWTVLPSGVTCDGPAATILDTELHVVVRGLDGYSLWHWDGASGSWISGATSSAPTFTS